MNYCHYDVPARWENNADEEVLQNEYQKIIENPKLVEIDKSNSEGIKGLIDELLIIECSF